MSRSCDNNGYGCVCVTHFGTRWLVTHPLRYPRQDFRLLSVDCGINRCALTATLPLEGNLLFREATTSNNVSYLKIIFLYMAVFRFCTRQDSALDWVMQLRISITYIQTRLRGEVIC